MKTIIMFSVLGSFVACSTSSQPRFDRMSEEELIAYNQSVPAQERVYCREEVAVGSHIRRRICSKVQDVINGGQTTLNTPSQTVSIPNQ